MAKLIFAKLFELHDLHEYQVLVTKEYDPEDDTFKIVQTIDFEDVRPSLSLGFKDENKCNEYFDAYDKERAMIFLKEIKSTIEANF